MVLPFTHRGVSGDEQYFGVVGKGVWFGESWV